MHQRRQRAGLAISVIASVAAFAAPGSAAADPVELPTPGTTTQCSFSAQPAPARTSCRTETITVNGPVCLTDGDQPYLLYDVTFIDSVREYAGNVVAGEPVNGYYTAVLPHAKLLYDSGPHAFSTPYVIYVESC
jgi:hypothetical protein